MARCRRGTFECRRAIRNEAKSPDNGQAEGFGIWRLAIEIVNAGTASLWRGVRQEKKSVRNSDSRFYQPIKKSMLTPYCVTPLPANSPLPTHSWAFVAQEFTRA